MTVTLRGEGKKEQYYTHTIKLTIVAMMEVVVHQEEDLISCFHSIS